MAKIVVQSPLCSKGGNLAACAKRALFFLGFLVVYLPVAVFGQEQMPKIQIHTGADLQELSNLSIQAFEKSNPTVLSYSLELSVGNEGATHPSGGIGPTGSDLFEGLFPSVHVTPGQDLRIGDADLPVSAAGFTGNKLRDLQQMIGDAISVTVLEGNSKTFEVNLDSQPSDTVTVIITGHENTDLEVSPTKLTFTPTNWALQQRVTLTANLDSDDEGDQVTLQLTASEGDADPSKVEVMIIDVEVLWERPSRSLLEGSWTRFGVSLLPLLAPPSGDVTFTVTGHENTDLRPSPTLTFPKNSWQESQWLSLTTELDGDFLDDYVTLTLTAEGGGYSGLKYTIDVTIIDRRPQEVLITEGGTKELRFSMKGGRRPRPLTDQIAIFDQYDGTDLTLDPTQLTFRAETWHPCIFEGRNTVCSDFETTTLSAGQDEDALDDENMMLLIVTGPPGNPQIGVKREIYVRVEDDDRSRLVIEPSDLEINEGGREEFTVKLSDPPLIAESDSVTVTVPAFVGNLTTDQTSLVFDDSNWNVAQTVTLMAAEDDDLQDEIETLWLTAQGGDIDNEQGRVVVTIIDNDMPDLLVTPRLMEMVEGTSRAIDVTLLRKPSANVIVIVSGYEGTDLAGTPPRPLNLIFTPQNYDVTQRIMLTADDDNDLLDEDIIMLRLIAFGAEYVEVTAEVMVRIRDNDVPGIIVNPPSVTMEEGSERTLDVTLAFLPMGRVTVNFSGHVGTDLGLSDPLLTFTTSNWNQAQTVTLTAAEDEDYEEDTVEVNLTASGGGYNGEEAPVTVTITDNDERPIPLAISIYDRRELEDAETIQLPIELSRPTDAVVTVQYASTDGTAESGLDYTASRGIVIFDPGATQGVIEIEITDDDVPESTETFAVTLLKPRNAIIARGTGTGTILDNDGGTAILRVEDALVQEEEGMVRFQVSLSHPQRQMISAAYRTQDGTAKAGEDYEAASGVVTLAPGTLDAMIAVPLLKDGLDWQEETFTVHLESSENAEIAKAVGVATIQAATTVSQEALEAYTARFVRTSATQVVEALGDRFRGADGTACGAATRAEMSRLWYSASSWDPSLGELLGGCRMSATSYSGSFSVWGRGAFRQFNGREDDGLTLDGEVTTGMLGADYRWKGGWLAGVLLSHSQGEGSFAAAQESGEITAGLTGVYPYVSVARAGWEVWLSAGAGRGQADVLELDGDLTSRFGAMGVRGTLVSSNTIGLNYHGDVLATDAEIEAHAVTAEVYRVRAGVEANAQINNVLRPYVEANVRSDGGSAETGVGLEFGGGMRIAYPAWRLKADVHAQGLVMHTAAGFSEWGISGFVQVGNRSEGLMMRVRPSWGLGQGMSLYGQQTIRDAAPMGTGVHRTELELGYGVPWKEGSARSIMGMTQLSQGRMYRLGGELHPWERLTFSVFGLANGRAASLGDIGLNVRGSLRY